MDEDSKDNAELVEAKFNVLKSCDPELETEAREEIEFVSVNLNPAEKQEMEFYDECKDSSCEGNLENGIEFPCCTKEEIVLDVEECKNREGEGSDIGLKMFSASTAEDSSTVAEERPPGGLQYHHDFNSVNNTQFLPQSYFKGKKFSCSYCDFTCVGMSPLLEHLRKHSRGKTFVCPNCGGSFKRKSYMVEHMRTHTGEKPYLCPHCDKSFAQRAHLIGHSRKHTGEKPFVCSHCGNRFTRKSSLSIHTKLHTGEKPFSCPNCNNRFVTKSDLLRHLRTHTVEKPFSCTHCTYECTKKASLVYHLRTHTEESSFSCPLCEYTASRKKEVVDHLKKHAGGKSLDGADSFTEIMYSKEKPFVCSL